MTVGRSAGDVAPDLDSFAWQVLSTLATRRRTCPRDDAGFSVTMRRCEGPRTSGPVCSGHPSSAPVDPRDPGPPDTVLSGPEEARRRSA